MTIQCPKYFVKSVLIYFFLCTLILYDYNLLLMLNLVTFWSQSLRIFWWLGRQMSPNLVIVWTLELLWYPQSDFNAVHSNFCKNFKSTKLQMLNEEPVGLRYITAGPLKGDSGPCDATSLGCLEFSSGFLPISRDCVARCLKTETCQC